MNADYSLLTVTLTLFFIMDPLGNVQPFLTLMQDTDPKRQRLVMLREMLIALVIMILFNYLGEILFKYLELSEPGVRIASGVILFLIAIKIMFPGQDSLRLHLPPGEPFIIPLAIPLIAGPGVLATIMLFAHLETCQPLMLSSIVIAWLCCCIVFLVSPYLNRWLGKNGLVACEKLVGMVLVMLAIQRFMEGVQQLIAARPS